MKYPYLSDSDFLLEIDNANIKVQYIKIILLDWQENPIQEIQGQATSGNISVNGASSLRRTGNISIIIPNETLPQLTDPNYMFSINKKIQIEVGFDHPFKSLSNTLGISNYYYNEYPIIWFPQGTFILMGSSIQHTNSGLTANLQFRDKMALLNGDVGGTIPASTQFDEYETIDANGKYIIEKPNIEQIIRELVHHFGEEQLGKIIISDIDSKIKMVMRWLGNTPIYLINDSGSYSMTTNYAEAAGKTYTMFEYGQDIGYIYTDFTYPSELIGDAGSSVVTVLEKIKSTLGNHEFFYDIYGNFIWQEIANYLNTTEATVQLNELLTNADYLVDQSRGKSTYDFTNSKIVSSYSNNPQFSRIKNDYTIWGIKKSTEGVELPIRYHLVIDKKPAIGNIYEVYLYEDPTDKLTKAKSTINYSNYAELVAIPGVEGNLYKTEDDSKIYIWEEGAYIEIDIQLTKVKTTDWRSELYLQGVVAESLGLDSNYYYAELATEWPKLYNLAKSSYIDPTEGQVFLGDFHDEVLRNPSSIDYFLDFIDTNNSLSNLAVSAIGRRAYNKSNNAINCIFAPHIPDFVLIELGQPDTDEKRDEAILKGQQYIQVDPSIYKLLGTGGISNDAYTEVRNLLHENTKYNEAVQIQIMPIYYLEPNTRITINDPESDMYGDYMINTIAVPFATTGTMSIGAAKAIEKI